jgi:hypothetical protein
MYGMHRYLLSGLITFIDVIITYRERGRGRGQGEREGPYPICGAELPYVLYSSDPSLRGTLVASSTAQTKELKLYRAVGSYVSECIYGTHGGAHRNT